MVACVDCKYCKSHRPGFGQVGFSYERCMSPHATEHHRIHGPYQPSINDDVTKKCDAGGWFEPKTGEHKRLWWML